MASVSKSVIMATTWPRKRRGKPVKNDPKTKRDALAARRVLRDAHRARHELLKVASEGNIASWRLRWVTVITILRAVGLVLRNIDSQRSSEMNAAIMAAWKRWDQEAFQHLIFHEFIKRERDTILKQYRFGTTAVVSADTVGPSDTTGPYANLLIGDRTYSVFEAVDSAISWWEKEISKIEADAGNSEV